MIRFLRFFVFLVAKSLYAMDDGTPQEPPYSGRAVPLCVIDGVLNQGSVPEAPQSASYGYVDFAVSVLQERLSFNRELRKCEEAELERIKGMKRKKNTEEGKAIQRIEGIKNDMKTIVSFLLILQDKSMDVFDKIEHLHLNLRAFLGKETAFLGKVLFNEKRKGEYMQECVEGKKTKRNYFLKEGFLPFLRSLELEKTEIINQTEIPYFMDLYEGSFRFLRDSYKEDMKLIKIQIFYLEHEASYSAELGFSDSVIEIISLESRFLELFKELSESERLEFYALYPLQMNTVKKNSFVELEKITQSKVGVQIKKPYISPIFPGHTIPMHEHISLLRELINNASVILGGREIRSSHEAGVGAGSED
jgi:hypothetical protein